MIDSRLKNFSLKIIVAAAVMTVTAAFVFVYLIPNHYVYVLPWMLLFFALTSILIHGYQLSLVKKDMGKFTRSNMLLSMIRLMLYSFFAIGYLILDGTNAVAFLICLVVVYLVFTILELKDTTRIMRS